MAYFPNGTYGMCFDEQCLECRYGTSACPIYNVQMNYNYKAANNDIATAILNDLVKNDGSCLMFIEFRKDFQLTEGEKTQLYFEY